MTFISGIHLWHLYLTFIFDIYIWHFYLTFISGIYIWHCNLSLTYLSDIYIWHSYLTFIRLSYVNWKVYWFTHRIAKPLYLPLQIFFNTKNNTLFQKTRTKLAASEGYWRLLTSPIVEKKHVHFPTVNPDSSEKCIEYIFHYCFQKSSEKCIGSPNPLFYRCKFSAIRKWRHFFKKLQRERPRNPEEASAETAQRNQLVEESKNP